MSPDAEGAQPLVMPNPAFFDRSLPPGQPQVVTVFLPFLQPAFAGGLPNDWREPATRIRDGLDWGALEALVRR